MINRLLTPEQPSTPVAAPEPATTGELLGDRVHHEFFLGEQTAAGVPWLCRVYAQNGAVSERSGTSSDQASAQSAALSWAALTKAALRGVA